MASMTVSPASCLMALVTSSLVSRTATPGSTGTSQAQMAARTWLRASAAAAGPAVSRTRRRCSSVGRVGAIVFIGFLSGPVRAGPGERWSLCGLRPGGSEQLLKCSVSVARQMVLQVAVRDIGQLTDFERHAARSDVMCGASSSFLRYWPV